MQLNLKSNISSVNLLLLTLGLFIFLPNIWQQGMFLDGVTYAAISNNLASGLGTFWEPHYTQTIEPTFSGHPPLAFILQSFFFRIFGNHFFTEKLYSLFTALLTAWGIVSCWKITNNPSHSNNKAWLPLLLWLSIPLVAWSYKNNMLENTMGVFSTFSVYFLLKACKYDQWYWLGIGALMICFAFLSKGFVGLFPLAVPLIFGVIYKKHQTAWLYVVVLAATTAMISLTALCLFPELFHNLSRYMETQMIPALNGKGETTTAYRFTILGHLFLGIAPMLGLSFLIILLRLKRKPSTNNAWNQPFWLFFLTALSASIPLMISLKQRNFYLIPSFPFFALAFACLLLKYSEKLNLRLPKPWISRIKISLFIAIALIISYSTFRFGSFSRDQAKIKDVTWVSQTVGKGAIVSCSPELWKDWGLHAYFSRIGYVSLDCDRLHPYFLIKNSDPFPAPYQAAVKKGSHYTLLKRNSFQDTLAWP